MPQISNTRTDKKNNRLVYIISAISAMGGMLFGYDTGVISGAILFIKQQFALSATLQEIVVSAVLLGAVIGAAVGGFLADRFGRRKIIILAAMLFILSGLGSALASTVTWLVVARVVVGMAVGGASFISPLYISEVAPKEIRGSLVFLNQLAITSGIVLAYLVDYGFTNVAGGWRWMLALSAVPAILLGVGMWFMPESPRWLVGRNKGREAQSILTRIRSHENVDDEIEEIRDSLEQQSAGWGQLFSSGIRKVLIVGVGLAILQQITGINTVIYYAPTILQFSGFESAAMSILGTIGIGAINVLFTLVTIWLIDRVGRRVLLLVGLVGMVLSLSVLGLAFQLPSLASSLSWIVVGSLMLYVASFAVGLGPVFWLLISEIYPLKVQAQAMSVATVANWAANLIVALTFLSLVQWIGRPFTFWLYALIGIGTWIFTYFLVPETKGRSLEDIQKAISS